MDLLKKMLTRHNFAPRHHPVAFSGRFTRPFQRVTESLLASRRLSLMRSTEPDMTEDGRGLSFDAETMIGFARLDNLQHCVTDVIERNVPGDLIETGVWRGGATIFMRGILKAYGDTGRTVWVADSFQGLPKPDAKNYPSDRDDPHWHVSALAVPVEEVRANFEKYGLLDDQVRFLPGWFKDTLPSAPIDRLAVLRLDGDMYESTIVALDALYPKLSAGGYLIVDDYGAVEACQQAVDDYRAQHGIEDAMHKIDWTGYYWQKGQSSVTADEPR